MCRPVAEGKVFLSVGLNSNKVRWVIAWQWELALTCVKKYVLCPLKWFSLYLFFSGEEATKWFYFA